VKSLSDRYRPRSFLGLACVESFAPGNGPLKLFELRNTNSAQKKLQTLLLDQIYENIPCNKSTNKRTEFIELKDSIRNSASEHIPRQNQILQPSQR